MNISETLISTRSRILGIVVRCNTYDYNIALMVNLIVVYLKTIFDKVDEYVTYKDEEHMRIYFPNIIVDDDPMYNTILDRIRSSFKDNNMRMAIENFSFDLSPSEIAECIPSLSKGSFELTNEMISNGSEYPISNNSILTNMNEFKYLMLIVTDIV